jgi:protease YdgD
MRALHAILEPSMRQRLRLLLSCLAALSLCDLAAAAKLRPGIIGKDDRVRIANAKTPWSAIGQVNIGGYRSTKKCTGTLIEPNVVITAAHCVVDPRTGQPFPLHNIHFLAGVSGSKNLGHATAQCVHVKEGYKSDAAALKRTGRMSVAKLSNDMATIVLKNALPVTPAPLATSLTAKPGLALVHASYPADRRFALSASNCKLLPSDFGAPLWLNDCDTHPASSGGPLLTKVEGSFRLAAIMTATGDGDANLAVPVSQGAFMPQASCP